MVFLTSRHLGKVLKEVHTVEECVEPYTQKVASLIPGDNPLISPLTHTPPVEILLRT